MIHSKIMILKWYFHKNNAQ